MAAEGLAMRPSTTTAAFSIKVFSSAKIADDWNSVCFTVHPTEARFHAKSVPLGFENFGLAMWTDKLDEVHVGLQTGQSITINLRRWQPSCNDKDKWTQGDKDTTTTAWPTTPPCQNPAVDDDAPHGNWPSLPSEGMGSQRELIPGKGGGNQTRASATGLNNWHSWSCQGLVQEICTPDKSDQWGGPTDIDRSRISSFTVLLHKRYHDDTMLVHNEEASCPIDECKRTTGVMKLTNIAKNLMAADIGQLTAHGAEPKLREKWVLRGLAEDPNVVNFNTQAQIPPAAYNMYKMAAQVVVSLPEEIPTVSASIGQLAVVLDNTNLERVDCTSKEDVSELRKSLMARISDEAPNIGYSFMINSALGTMAIIAEVLQLDSPLLADILIALA